MSEAKTRERILIVEDDPEERAAIRRYLSASGRDPVNLQDCKTGAEALAACRADRPAGILVNNDLPDMSGLEFLSRLRGGDAAPPAPVIMLTARGDEGLAAAAIEAGAHRYLAKEKLSPEALAETLDDAVERFELLAERERQRELLAETNRTLTMALAAADAGVWSWNVRSGAIHWSPEMYVLYGVDRADGPPTYAAWERALHPDDLAHTNAAVEAVIHGRAQEFRGEFRIRHPAWGERWLLGIGRVERDPRGRAVTLSGINLDVTARKRVEEALQRSEAHNRAVFEYTGIGISEIDPATGRMTRVNGRFCRLLGYTADELTRKTVRDITHPDDHPASTEAFRRVQSEEIPEADLEKRCVRKDGSTVWTRVNVTVVRANGAAATLVATLQDISARRQAEAALREREEHLRLAFDAAKMGSWDWDLATDRIKWSASLERIFNYAQGEFDGTIDTFRSLVHPDDRDRVGNAMERALSGEADYDIEFRMRRADGSERWAAVRAIVLRDAAGRPVRMVGVDHDVTERKQAEIALRASETRMRLASDAAGFGVHDLDVATQRGSWSPELRRIVGVETPGEISFETTLATLHPGDRARAKAEMEAVMRRPGPYEIECRILRPDGTERWALDRGEAFGPVDPVTGRVARVVGTLIDITERKKSELALRESEARLNLALNASATGVWDWDLQSDAVNWSPEAYAIHALKSFEGTGAAFFRLVHPDDAVRVRATVEAAIAERKIYEAEFRIVRPDGTQRWVSNLGRVFYAVDGKPERVLGTITDITDRKQAEERSRLLARELDHRARNVLTLVQSIVRITEADDVEELKRVLSGRFTALTRAHALLSQGRWNAANVRRLVLEELEPYRAADPGRVRIEGADIHLSFDAAQTFAMAVHELATNSAKYGALSAASGRLEIAWSGADDEIVFRWMETGGPPVKPPTRQGFGSAMIQQSIEYQLQGDVRLDWRPEGLCCTIRLPREVIVRPPET